jgi:hypothetical protein
MAMANSRLVIEVSRRSHWRPPALTVDQIADQMRSVKCLGMGVKPG